MVKCKTVSIEEIKENNPRLCLSAKRMLGKCYMCPSYISTRGIPCDSRIVIPKYEAKVKKKRELLDKIKEINKELEEYKNVR